MKCNTQRGQTTRGNKASTLTATRWTPYGGQVDEHITAYLQPVLDVIVDQLPGLKAVYVFGGFGRGEGSVYFKTEKKNGKKVTVPWPVNDFEIVAVTEHKLDEVTVNHVASQASQACPINQVHGHTFVQFDRQVFSDTFYVDLKVLAEAQLPKLLPMIRYYELKHASQLVWGEDVRDKMAEYSVSELPWAEGLRMLLNRLAMCSLYFDVDFFTRSLSEAESKALLYLAGKAVIDIPAALLLLNGEFVPSYQGRAELFAATWRRDFPELVVQVPGLADDVTAATNFKLRPKFGVVRDPIKIWTKYKRDGGFALQYLLGKMGEKNTTGRPRKTVFKWVQSLHHLMPSQYYEPYLRIFWYQHTGLSWYPPGTTWLFQRYYNMLMFWRMGRLQGRWYSRLLWAPRGYEVHVFSAMLALLYSLQANGKIHAGLFHLAQRQLATVYLVPAELMVEQERPSQADWQRLNTLFADAYLLFSYLKLV